MGKMVLVSGAGAGIGLAIAAELAERNYAVALLGRNETRLRTALEDLPHPDRHVVVPADVCDPEALRTGLAKADIDCLHAIVANAGVGGENQYGPEDRWCEILDTNLSGVYYLVNEALPYLKSNRADTGDYRHILAVSSILARLGVPGYAAYCASKAGLLGLVRAWAAAFSDECILVNAICPGWVNTDMARQGLDAFAQSAGKTFDEILHEQMAKVPLGKMSEPEEIAKLTAFLISEAQCSITGQTLDINNGAVMP